MPVLAQPRPAHQHHAPAVMERERDGDEQRRDDQQADRREHPIERVLDRPRETRAAWGLRRALRFRAPRIPFVTADQKNLPLFLSLDPLPPPGAKATGSGRWLGRVAPTVRMLAGALLVVLAATGAGEAAARERPTRFTIGVTGDLLPHLPIVARARTADGYDFRPMLRPIRGWVRGNDLAFCHVETPLMAGVPAGYPLFRSPPALARAVRATGFDACSTASNHSLDRGRAGIAATRRALRRAGLRHTGSFSARRQRSRPLLLRARGVKVAFLSYTQITNGIPLPRPWAVNIARARRIVADARRARRAGAGQ